MKESAYQEPLPTFERNPYIRNEGNLSMSDHMTALYLQNGPDSSGRIDYLDVSDFIGFNSIVSHPPTPKIDIQMKSYEDKQPNQSTNEDSVDDEDDPFFHPPPQKNNQSSRKKPRNVSKSPPKRDYSKNITINVVHSCCRDFQKDVLAQKVVKSKCKKSGVSYRDFVSLIKTIFKEHHISNGILLNRYLSPPSSDPQFILKGIFAEYFSYFLDNCLVPWAQQSTQVKDLQAYISYSRKYLAYLGTKCDSQNISSQNNRI